MWRNAANSKEADMGELPEQKNEMETVKPWAIIVIDWPDFTDAPVYWQRETEKMAWTDFRPRLLAFVPSLPRREGLPVNVWQFRLETDSLVFAKALDLLVSAPCKYRVLYFVDEPKWIAMSSV